MHVVGCPHKLSLRVYYDLYELGLKGNLIIDNASAAKLRKSFVAQIDLLHSFHLIGFSAMDPDLLVSYLVAREPLGWFELLLPVLDLQVEAVGDVEETGNRWDPGPADVAERGFEASVRPDLEETLIRVASGHGLEPLEGDGGNAAVVPQKVVKAVLWNVIHYAWGHLKISAAVVTQR